MKKQLGFILFLIILGLTLVAAAETISGSCLVAYDPDANSTGGDANHNWTLDLSTGKLTISGSGELKEYPHGSPWDNDKYSGCKDYREVIKSIVVEEGTIAIPHNIFTDYKYLTSVQLPNSLISIGPWSFSGCKFLEKVQLGSELKEISYYAFLGCSALKKITLPNNVTNLHGWAFTDCPALLYTAVGSETAKQLSSQGYTFWDKNYPGIEMKYTVSDNGDIDQFDIVGSDTTITSITWPAGVTRVGNNAFKNCATLTEVSVPEGITILNGYVFSGCKSLNKLTLPSSLREIGAQAFSGCSALKELNLPSNITNIGGGIYFGSFEGCDALRYTAVGSETAKAMSKEGYTFRDKNYPGLDCLCTVSDEGEITQFRINKADKTITSCKIPKHITNVDVGAFSSCNSLTDVYYDGNRKEWEAITIDKNNDPLVKAKKHLSTQEYTVTVTSSDTNAGKATATPASGLEGTSVTLTATANKGYQFKEWQVSSGEVKIGDDKFIIDTEDIEITAVFEAQEPEPEPEHVHDLKKHEKIDATEDAEGTEAYWECTGCKKLFSDAEGKKEIEKPIVIPKLEPTTPEGKIKAFVKRCYILILNRDADEGGLNGWSDALKKKTATAAQIIDGFVRSAEFINRSLGNDAAVVILYQTMLGRAADEGGKAGWVDALNKGYTLQNIIDGFCGSPEFTAICDSFGIEAGSVNAPAPADMSTPRGKIEAFVKRCYSLILSRDADQGGLQGWSDALESGAGQACQIIDGFVRSPEYVGRNLSNAESVDILYKTMLNRSADEGGKAGWVDAMNQGYTLQHIINGFCGSAEFTAICNDYGISAGTLTVASALVRREAITPEGDEAEAPVVYQGYNSEFINEEKVRAFVEHCYESVFGREGDAEGIENYTKLILDGKKTLKKVAYEFVFSAEFQGKLPGNEAFIRILYRLYFDREADAEELAGWVQMLEDGTSLEEIVNGFAGSAEFKAIVNGMKD